MNTEELRQKHGLLNLFLELCEIPSPPLKEAAVAEKIMQIFRENNITAEYDDYKNIIARIPGAGRYKDVQPLLLSAHMDVVGGSEEVITRVSDDGKYIETDKTRTLGADDKAGAAAILDLAIELVSSNEPIEHAPIEITFTRDEEKGMTGIRRLDTSGLESKYAIIVDGDALGELNDEGAGFTNIFVKVHGGKGGHSGVNIHEKSRISAVKVLSEFASGIPQGVYKYDPQKGVITSINAGVCIGGAAGTFISEMLKDVYSLALEGKPIPGEYGSCRVIDTINRSAALNTITSEAATAYSLRSSDPQNEQELIKTVQSRAGALNDKYKGLIKIDVDVEYHIPIFARNDDDFLPRVIMKAGKNCGINSVPSSFHAGAETHILSNEKQNKRMESFIPVIIGVANLRDIHSPDEKIDWQSFLTGRKWLGEILRQFSQDSV